MQRTLLSVGLLLAIALPCQAQNKLTPKEIANGWILLFDGETTFGWSQEKGREPMTARDGILNVYNEARFTMPFGDFELSYEYRSEAPRAHVGVGNLRGPDQAIALKVPKDWTKATILVRGNEVRFTGTREEVTRPTKGNGTIHFFELFGDKLMLRNIKLRPLDGLSLFDGRDLDGWREFPGKKSKFAVIDRAINVKDGPGDLQTVRKYKDFILQLECKSNGKYLNSGIFFRCRENEYQNGYEAQIRNEFTKEATQKYLVEEYDPKTNKLVGKKEMMSSAVDFGTGAIYRRVPARKAMSKDGEWFGMTIVAHGNHLATWVNGVQVTDWYDNRPKSDNARTGCRLEGGHISIQGHDPTTDLSFRNFRIAELK
ncbi:MAG: DUF1080 domain-containing protein [Gemmataceae bacterium]|nr:DUF1080 domain-containing protein [Gemmataceae bacterium]